MFLNVIDPGFLLEVREATKAAAMESGNMTEEQYEDVKGMMETFTSPTVMAISIVVMYTFIGLIISLISGLFMKTASQA